MGIPTVLLGFSDQETLAYQVALNFGCPNIRYVSVPRVGQGAERVAQFWDEMVKALTEPLTPKEQESGLYVPPPDPRICFTGTIDDAQEFYGKTSPISQCKNCPIAQWTDGLPITLPTEERVEEMLTGTSHAPEEYIVYPTDRTVRFSTSGITMTVKAGDPVYYLPMAWGTTVEKVAVNAVIAGCTNPLSLPVLLAAYQTGSPFVTTNCPAAYGLNIAGPIVKELELNAKQPFQVGNPGLMTIGRAYSLMMQNIGGGAQGSSNTNLGHPVNRTGLVAAEDTDSLPSGWEWSNEMGNVSRYNGTSRQGTREDSVVGTWGAAASMMGFTVGNFAPEAFYALNRGEGPIARALGVEGKPGKYNILEYFIPQFTAANWGGIGRSMIISPDIAQSLYEAGFTSKKAVSSWLGSGIITYSAKFYRAFGWFDFGTTGGTRVDSTTGIMYKDLPDNYMFVNRSGATIIVSNCLGDASITFCNAAGGSFKLIDDWR